jgi:hypothetical protein
MSDQYPNVSASLLAESQSQYQQDLWVLNRLGSNGFYVEIGCGDGFIMSNTYLLEKAGWRGISVDPFPLDWSGRRNRLVVGAIWDKEVSTRFVCGAYLGGIEECLGKWKEGLRDTPVVELETIHIRRFLEKYDVPRVIDYLSLDTEGSEYDILAAFPWDTHSVRMISVEHNHEEPKRTQIRELLEGRGMKLEKSIDVEDFYSCIGDSLDINEVAN